MTRPVNPYVAGAPLHSEGQFFGRQDILNWVTQELQNPATNALVLFGQRRIGKTSLLLRLEQGLPRNFFCPFYFDLQDQAKNSLGQVLADLADTIVERFGTYVPDAAVFDDQGQHFRQSFLPQIYQKLDKNCRPVFLLDEFDVLDQVARQEQPSKAAETLFPFLRRLMREDPVPAFVFVVGRRADDLGLDFSSTFKASLVKEVWVLDRSSAITLVRQAEVNGSLCFSGGAVERILALTNCHPYMLQLLCQRIWERAFSSKIVVPWQVDEKQVEAAVDDALEVGDQALEWLWDGLSPAEKIYASALAEVADEGQTLSQNDIVQMLVQYAARLRTREIERAAEDLVRRHVLNQVERGTYCFAVELFRRWVRRKKSLRDVKDELDKINPLADMYYELGQNYFLSRNWESAVNFFRLALKEYGGHFRARLNLGETLLEQEHYEEAVSELEHAYQLDQEEARLALVRAFSALAEKQRRDGREDQAVETLERALKISPNERWIVELLANIWTQRGDAAAQVGNETAALQAYIKADNQAKVIQLYIQRAERFVVSEDWATAAESLEWLIKHDTDEPRWQQELDRARQELQQEQQLDVRYEEGLKAIERNEWRAAQRALADVVRRKPGYKQAAYYLHLAVTKETRSKQPGARFADGDMVCNKYKICQMLGAGGEGIVYLAEDMLLGLPVAVKVLRQTSHFEDYDQIRRRFCREAYLGTRLTHPNILRVYDLIDDCGDLYLAMEYAGEKSLSEYLQLKKVLPVIEAIDIAMDICRALQCVHEHGIVHADVRPNNILRVMGPSTEESHVVYKLSDFGFATDMAQQSVQSECAADAGEALRPLGAWPYVSPERLNNLPLDGRADIYSLGITLYELVTGEPPFPLHSQLKEDVDRVIKSHLETFPAAPDLQRKGVCAGVSRCILKMLQKQPENRYKNVNEMLEALEEARTIQRQWEDQLEKSYRVANQLLMHARWEKAIEALSSLIEGNAPYETLALNKAFAEAMLLMQKEQWPEALSEWEQICSQDPSYRGGEVSYQLDRARKEVDLAKRYQQALDLETDEEWDKAGEFYTSIIHDRPAGYRDAQNRLRQVEKQIQRRENYEAAKQYLERKEWDRAIERLAPIVQENPSYDQDQAAQSLALAKRQKNLESLYEEGTALANQGKWHEAIRYFEEITHIDAGYRDAVRQMNRARLEVQKQLDSLYQQGKIYIEQENWAEAEQKFEEILKIDQSFRDSEKLLREMQLSRAKSEEQKQLDSFYQQSKIYFEQEDWTKARQMLEEVIKIDPSYKDADKLLQETKSKMSESRPDLRNSPFFPLVGGTVVGALIIAMLNDILKSVMQLGPRIIIYLCLIGIFIWLGYFIQGYVAHRNENRRSDP